MWDAPSPAPSSFAENLDGDPKRDNGREVYIRYTFLAFAYTDIGRLNHRLITDLLSRIDQ